MVCIECNGKGYLVTEEGEIICPDCNGRGEYIDRPNGLFFVDPDSGNHKRRS